METTETCRSTSGEEGMYLIPQCRRIVGYAIEKRNLNQLKRIKSQLKKEEQAARQAQLDEFYESHPLVQRVREIIKAYGY
jgi:hypothetical protein